MGRKLVDLTGQRFGRLVVQEYLGRRHHSSFWRCVCDCGTTTDVMASSLKTVTKSCGCWKRDRMASLTLKHGERGGERRDRSPEYKAWDSIKQRCLNPKTKGWEWYGGRGIRIANEWRYDFSAFLAHVGPRPSPQHSIDRIDSNGDYAPGNVRWATWTEQARNRSNNRIVNGVTLKQAAERAGIPYKTVKGRIAKGWSVERALETPVDGAKVAAQRHHRKAERATT